MALSTTERQILDRIDSRVEKNAERLQTVSVHVGQISTKVGSQEGHISELFEQTRIHADNITTLKAQHEMCNRNNDPGTLADRKNNQIAVKALLISSLLGLAGLVTSIFAILR